MIDLLPLRSIAFLLVMTASVPVWAQRIHQYRVTVDPDIRSMQVKACFAGRPPAQLVAESLDAPAAFVEGKAVMERRQPLQPNGTEMRLKGIADDGCIEYSVNLAGGYTKNDLSGNTTKRVGRDLFTEVGLWFWRPAQLAPDEDIEVSFALPEGLAVSTPWRPVEPAREWPSYRIGHAEFDRPSAVAFGWFKEIPVEVPGAVLRLAILDGAPPADVDAMRTWIHDAAMSVAGVHGRFPVASPQILVVPGARAQEPTPWAYVLRGGQAAAHFFVNQRRPLRDYIEDWTAPHELSHLLLPYVTSHDAWLAEGMATYYQNVTRARSGAITPNEAWQRMHAGFKRGRDSAVKGMTLEQATVRMFRDGGYMRVYWSGAAMLLLADVELRSRSDNRQSLDTVLAQFADCCLDPNPEWTARQVFDKFDELSGTDVFRRLYDAHVAATAFPDLAQLYADIGLEALGGKVELKSDAPRIDVRDAIMARGTYATPAALLR
ncbi:MAG: hypothetical protein K2X67_04540 [Burkholderiales bacterium]|nr:hypothetical protein [Burkholderiales bacterium]